MHNSLFLFSVIHQNITEQKKIYKFANEEDLTGAAIALQRLQDTYKLDTTEVAHGFIDGVEFRLIHIR
jgi:prolyl 4-hydroxylase